jgi:2-polyprenyl-3-methyl-5-hydroxy-6-metoxy-1,4-benzoquinol methylase
MKSNPSNEQMKQVYYTNVRHEMVHFVPADCKRILDVGCSEGNFGKLLMDRNQAEVWGVELSDDAAAIAGKKLNKVYAGDFRTILPKLPLGYFDCLVFNDVLEHFTDPEKVLRQCLAILSPGGYLVSSIPNVRYIGNLVEVVIKKDWEYKSGGILDRTHYRFFTQKSIHRMFNEAGYTVVKCTGINATPSFKTWLLGILTFGHMADVKFLEFATVAKLS